MNKNIYLSEERYQFLAEACEQMSLSSVWGNVTSETASFDERKETFFYFLTRVLSEGRLKLKKNDEDLTGMPEELVQLFRSAFPDSDIPNINYPDEDVSYWFFDDECPGQAVWRGEHPDGTIEWMHCP